MSRALLSVLLVILAADSPSRDAVSIPAGAFMMSALDQGTGQLEADGVTKRAGTVHAFPKAMEMSRTEITQAEFQATLHRNPSKFKDAPDSALRPVEQVTLFDAIEYCNEKSKRDSISPRYALDKISRQQDGSIRFAIVKDLGGPGWRLPTEAEWEYACRAGNMGAWGFGDDELAIGTFSWGRDQSGGSTHAVSGKKPNAWGLYDMHGNVWEWCFDPTADPGSPQPFRGGSWFNCPVCAKSDSRSLGDPVTREATVGFRVLRTPQ